MFCTHRTLALVLLVSLSLPAFAQKEFGFDNRKASGQPYLKPEETVKRMKVADGFEVKLFAAEPMVVNPIAMTVDEKGRVWVVECFEYPKRTPKGKMPRDRIIILEDSDGDGVADKRTVFAEGKDFPKSFDLASGIEVGHGGVFLGAPPYLWFIENKNDKPGKFEILLSGFGSQDTHETLNTFQWGPDGRLYGLHGVFTHSEVKSGDDSPGIKMNAAVWRYDPSPQPSPPGGEGRVRGKFEVFAEGTSNPWGMDWRNTDGQFILCCCVIPHLFHISPGGIYKRQAGQSFNPYVYSYLNEICDHTFHRESGWAHAGLISLDTPLMPKEYHDSVIFGSIHGCSIKRNVLKRNGSTYTASRADDFLQSGDKNFRPINLRWGHNGEIYCIDWHDQHPCHQTNPDDWDYAHGRVYRIQPKGLKTKKAEDLGRKKPEELIRLVRDDNPYVSRTALRLLGESLSSQLGQSLGLTWARPIAEGDLRALWLMSRQVSHNSNAVKPLLQILKDDTFSKLPNPAFRGWLVRTIYEADGLSPEALRMVADLAATERAPEVRLELAAAARHLGKNHDTSALLHNLVLHKEDAKDPVIPQLIWLAYEPKLTSRVQTELEWLKDNAAGNPLLTETIVPRAMRRLVATGKPEDLAACVAFVGTLKDTTVRRQALVGLAQAVANRPHDAPAGWKAVYTELLKDCDPEIRRLAQQLAVNFQDPEAIRRALAVAADPKKAAAERVEAVRDLGLTRRDFALKPLLALVARDASTEVRVAACRALANYDTPEAIRDIPSILTGWEKYPVELRVEVVNLLAGRKEWARVLLDAVGRQQVARTDLTDNTILRIRALRDRNLDAQIAKVWGTVRDTPAELNALIDKLRGQINEGRPSFARGQKVFETHCAKCHKFEGKGHDVGPALDGAARDIEYLLANVIDPNRVVGQPYFTRLVTLKNGRVESGLLAAEDDQAITLKAENDALKVIPKKDVEDISIQQKSVMPEGLANNMKVDEFRDLVRYLMAHPFLTEVSVTEPLDPRHPAVVQPTMLLSASAVRWERPTVGVAGRIALPPGKGDAEVVAVVAAEVTAPAAMRTKLLVGAGAPLRAWLNGKQVYDGRPGNSAAPDQAVADVELQPGRNLLLFQVTYRGSKEALYARLLDPNRKLRYAEAKN